MNVDVDIDILKERLRASKFSIISQHWERVDSHCSSRTRTRLSDIINIIDDGLTTQAAIESHFTLLQFNSMKSTRYMMTSSNGNIFRVTGHLHGEFTCPAEFSAHRPVTRSFDVFFDLHLNKRMSKQSVVRLVIWGVIVPIMRSLLCTIIVVPHQQKLLWHVHSFVAVYFDGKLNLYISSILTTPNYFYICLLQILPLELGDHDCTMAIE